MSPLPVVSSALHAIIQRRDSDQDAQSEKPTDANGLVLEAWAEGFMIGALIIMSCVTLANMRRGVLLHKLILLELVMGYWQGVFILFNQPIYGWWLSVAAIPLNASWVLHNVISWMKLKPFMTPLWSRLFIGTVILSIPYWITEIYANFAFFHQVNTIFLKTRPFEALCRDPWWIITTVALMYNIKTKYELTIAQIVRISPRFAVMLGAMFLSVCFIVLDVLSVTSALKSSLPVGINPFWKLSFVFKCLTDAVVLDDFKTALDRLRAFKVSRLGSFAGEGHTAEIKEHRDAIMAVDGWAEPLPAECQTPLPIANLPPMPSIPNSSESGEMPWRENKQGHVNHVEHGPAHQHHHHHQHHQEWPDMARTASRDRDDEENAIEAVHMRAESNPTTSDSPILRHRVSWQAPTNSSSDIDLDYAQAMREITLGSSVKSNRGPSLDR